ncbi:MAG: crossover junction endodeoxyribonuclease RuvC, partial [Pseudomonadota bacterium]
MMRLLGIDPGSRLTGFGVIEVEDRHIGYLTCGCIRTTPGALPLRLKEIFDGVEEVIAEFQPTELAIEKVFVHRNVDSAMKLGHARGAAIVA